MNLWVAFCAGILVGSFLGMFILAVCIVAGESGRGRDEFMERHRPETDPDIIPIRPAPSERRGFTQQGA